MSSVVPGLHTESHCTHKVTSTATTREDQP
jgi:hypothetical protein